MRGEQDPYIYHFPDGNASVARLLVRALVPGSIPGKTMEDIVLARADYNALDRGKQSTRLRLQSTAVNVAHTADRKNVDVSYVQYGQTWRVRGRHVILATYNQVIPALCPELSAAQKEALAFQEKAPIVYSNVLLRNWRAFAQLGINQIYSPRGFCHCAWLDFPVSMGGYAFSRDPDQPILLHAVHVPNQPGRGLSMREQFRLGRRQLYRMNLEDYRPAILAQLGGALAAGGFDAERDVADMTVNRWPHGYSYSYNELDDDPSWFGTEKGPHLAARAQHDRISIANADAQASAYLDSAMDSGIRAAQEQSKRA
jgi:spermidine dehydrogenase